MGIIRHWKFMASLAGLFALLAFGFYFYRKNSREELLQVIFASEAEKLHRGIFKNPSLNEEGVERAKEAITLLSNGVFDERVLLFFAQVKPPTISKYIHPIFKDSPLLCWFVVDELEQVALVGYADSNDPNAFGVPLFTIKQYCRLSPFGYDEMPKHLWSIPIKCYGETDPYLYPRLMKHDNGISQARVSLEVNVAEWNSLLSNRGQLIVRDRKNHELDRIAFVPHVDKKTRNIMRSIMLLYPNEVDDSNFTE